MKAVAHTDFEALAKSYYDPKMAYHSFEHITAAVAAGRTICDQCDREGIKVDRQAVYLALLFHDAGYHEDHQASRRFEAKEEYSAFIANQVLEEHGIDSKTIDVVTQAILATRIDAVPKSNEDKAVRMADIANVGGSYADFMENNRRFRAEVESANGPVSDRQWADTSQEILGCYLKDDLLLTQADTAPDGGSKFVDRALENLRRYLASV